MIRRLKIITRQDMSRPEWIAPQVHEYPPKSVD